MNRLHLFFTSFAVTPVAAARVALAALGAVGTLGSLGALAGCSLLGDEADVSIAPADTTLSDKGGDQLFTLTLSDAPEPYDVTKLIVRATADRKEASTLALAFEDKNADKRLDKGDAIRCAEPAANVFDGALVGKEVKVVVVYTGDGTEKQIASALWKPTK